MGLVSKCREWVSIAPQASEQTGWLVIPDETTRIEVEVSGAAGMNVKAQMNYKESGEPGVVWEVVSQVLDTKTTFDLRGVWTGPFNSGAQFQLVVTNQHATETVLGASAQVHYSEPDSW